MIPFAKRRRRPRSESADLIEVTFDDIEVVEDAASLPIRALPSLSPWAMSSHPPPQDGPTTVLKMGPRQRRSLIPYVTCLVWVGIFAGLSHDLVARGEGAAFVEALASFVDDRPAVVPATAARPVACIASEPLPEPIARPPTFATWQPASGIETWSDVSASP